MTWATAGVIAAIVSTALAVYGAYAYAKKTEADRASANAAAEQDRITREQNRYNSGIVDGKSSRQPEVDLLRSQRDDARRERDNERGERIDCGRRVDELERELRNRGHA